MSDLKKLPHRNWDELKDLWIDHIPSINFGRQFPGPTIAELPEAKSLLQPPSSPDPIPYFVGARESGFCEAIILVRKFTYCRIASFQAIKQGMPTWGVVAGYDACFYGAKAFCYLLGIVNIDKNSSWHIDLFAERIVGSGRRRQIMHDVLGLHNFRKRLDHDLLWSMTSRLIRTLHLPDNGTSLLAKLKSYDLDHVSSLRNSIIYNSGFWINTGNSDHCDLTIRLGNISMFRCAENIAMDEIETDYYFGLMTLISEILTYFLDQISDLAPALRGEHQAVVEWKSQVN